MNIEEEIYAELVKRFGVGEICIKKHGKRPAKTWLEFIKEALKLNTQELYSSCGFPSASTISRYFNRNFRELMLSKGTRCWYTYLLEQIDLKRCSKCNTIQSTSNFNMHSQSSNKLHTECKECAHTYFLKNRESILVNNKKYRDTHKIEIKEYHLNYSILNAEKIRMQKIVYRELNKDKLQQYRLLNKESTREYNKKYRVENKVLFRFYNSKHRAAKLQATPNWANLVAIKEIYATCPTGYHVDHIVPLQNDLVCGLHCEFNLQHLSAHDNLSKGNKYEP